MLKPQRIGTISIMLKKETSIYFWSFLTLAVIAVILISIKYLDAGIAAEVMSILRSIRPLHDVTANIPDILTLLVAFGTVLMWIIYFYRAYKKKIDVKEKFLKLAASTLPVSYLVKMLLQNSFGRTSPRDWLLHHKPMLFNGLSNSNGGSFPSGHMAVFVAFGTAIILYFPKFRKLTTILLILLGLALIGTDYHYLSDVVAGAYLGFVITYTLWYIYERPGVKN